MRQRHGSFRRALEISLLLHLLLLFIIAPRIQQLWPSAEEVGLRLVPERPVSQDEPLRFELVDLAEEREERPPDDPRVPLSDLDRRAHGGEGVADDRPSSRGNTPQLVQSQGDALPRPARPLVQPQPEVPPPDEPDEEQPDAETPEIRREPEGAGEASDQPATERPPIRIPSPADWSAAPRLPGMDENPERGGGQVDMGGLSFDTRWYDWGPYAKTMLAKIKRHWYEFMPEIAKLGAKGVVRIRFYIERDGTVTGLGITDESGRPPMDFAARDAITHSSPFEPLPPDLTGVEREGVTITFYYNTQPPDWKDR